MTKDVRRAPVPKQWTIANNELERVRSRLRRAEAHAASIPGLIAHSRALIEFLKTINLENPAAPHGPMPDPFDWPALAQKTRRGTPTGQSKNRLMKSAQRSEINEIALQHEGDQPSQPHATTLWRD